MDFRFEEVPNLTAEEIEVLVRSQSLTAEVQRILDYLAQYDSMRLRRQLLFLLKALIGLKCSRLMTSSMWM